MKRIYFRFFKSRYLFLPLLALFSGGATFFAGSLSTHSLSHTVKSIRLQHTQTPLAVYNLSVNRNETYFVSEQAVLVHNCSKGSIDDLMARVQNLKPGEYVEFQAGEYGDKKQVLERLGKLSYERSNTLDVQQEFGYARQSGGPARRIYAGEQVPYGEHRLPTVYPEDGLPPGYISTGHVHPAGLFRGNFTNGYPHPSAGDCSNAYRFDQQSEFIVQVKSDGTVVVKRWQYSERFGW